MMNFVRLSVILCPTAAAMARALLLGEHRDKAQINTAEETAEEHQNYKRKDEMW